MKRFWRYEELPDNSCLHEKKGIAHFFEIIAHRFIHFYLASALTALALLPGLVVFIVFCRTMPLISVFGCSLAGALSWPLYCGMCRIIWLSMKSFPGYLWPEFTEHVKKAFPRGMLTGALGCIVLGLTLEAIILIPADAGIVKMFFGFALMDFILIIAVLICHSTLWAISPGKRVSFKSVLLFFHGNLSAVLYGSILQGLYWLLIWLFFPYSVFLFALAGLWLPAMLSVFQLREATLT